MKKRRLIAAALVGATLLSGTAQASAAAPLNLGQTIPVTMSADPRASAQIRSYSSYIVSAGGGYLEVQVDIYGTVNPMATIGITKTEIEVQTGRDNWVVCKTFTDMFEYDAPSCSRTLSFLGIPGMTYRATSYLYAKDTDGGSDTRTVTTGSLVLTA